MPMTVVVTRDVPGRFRGFLASCMLEIAPGVYTSPNMSAGVRERVWRVLDEWHNAIGEGGLLMTWPDRNEPSRQAVRVLGWARRELVDFDGVCLGKVADHESSLITEDEIKEEDVIPF